MPSLRSRIRYQSLILSVSQEALAEAAEALGDATDQLEDLTAGTLDLDAITVGGVRFVESGGDLIPAP